MRRQIPLFVMPGYPFMPDVRLPAIRPPVLLETNIWGPLFDRIVLWRILFELADRFRLRPGPLPLKITFDKTRFALLAAIRMPPLVCLPQTWFRYNRLLADITPLTRIPLLRFE
jgi:hypothetical protein